MNNICAQWANCCVRISWWKKLSTKSWNCRMHIMKTSCKDLLLGITSEFICMTLKRSPNQSNAYQGTKAHTCTNHGKPHLSRLGLGPIASSIHKVGCWEFPLNLEHDRCKLPLRNVEKYYTANKCPQNFTRVHFHHKNIPIYFSCLVETTLHEIQKELLCHPLSSLDITPPDFSLFLNW